MDEITVEIRKSEELSQTLRDEIWEWLISEFVGDSDDTVWSKINWHILAWINDQLVGHLDIVERDVRFGDLELFAGGIGGVMVRPEWQSRGIGSRLMRSAHQFMKRQMRAEIGLLMCDEELVPFYQQLGWIGVNDPLIFDHPTGKRKFDDQVMVLPLRREDLPNGKIDIQGYPW